jgi:1,4-dihydroxy-6-naphthoate synthase
MPDLPLTTLQLGHSPDPDDAFMFYALAKEPPLIETGRWRFNHVLQDIQTLNQRARQGELEITAISIHAFPYVADKYALMSCGSSMGDGYGPMIVAKTPMSIDDLRGKTIAIPGKLTTAFLTMQLCLGKGAEVRVQGSGHVDSASPESSTLNPSFKFVVAMFDEIPKLVADGKVDAGLLIHEGQLTFKSLGLHLIVDLGVWWMEKTGLPLPLGGNVIRRDLGMPTMKEVTGILKRSIQYSLDHRKEAVEYALRFGRDLNRDLADKFVGMYVNHWTIDYGQRGRDAITRLLSDGTKADIVPTIAGIEFVEG